MSGEGQEEKAGAPQEQKKKKKEEGVEEKAGGEGEAEEDVTAGLAEREGQQPKVVAVLHPLVLLSVVDHYNRVARNTRRRVVGVLLGSRSGKRAGSDPNAKEIVDVSNSFAVPFEEDPRNPNVWYLDHNYLDAMFWMFKRVNAKENIVGFYSAGLKIKIRENDLQMDELLRRFCPEPIFVIIDVRPNLEGLPTKAYVAHTEVESEGREVLQRQFKHIHCVVGAEEAEEIGVEHLLRDINDPTQGQLANQIKHKMTSLSGLHEKLLEIRAYLANVVAGKAPVNNQILYNIQMIVNLLPNLNVEELVRSMIVKSNDMYLVIYLSSLIRCVIALHDLVNNKIRYRDMDDVLDEAVNAAEEAKK